VGITFEPIIIETSNWHQNVSNSTYYHLAWSYLTLVQWPFQALVKVNFAKLPILVRFCSNFAHMCRPHTNIPVQYPNIRSENVDVTLVSMATIWPIIKDFPFFVNNINIHTIIVSNMIEKLSLFFLHLFLLVERMVHYKFGKNQTKVKVKKMQTLFFTNVGITFEPIII
jgi:hypothetical protein